MDIAQLAIELDTKEAFRRSGDLTMQIRGVGLEAEKAGKTGTEAFNRMGQATTMPLTQLRNLNASLATSTEGIYAMQKATNGAAAALNGGGGGSGAGGGGGGGGGGLSGAAGGANNALTSMAASTLRAATAYLSLRTALREAKDILEVRMAFDRLDYGLKAITGSWEGARSEANFLNIEVDRMGLNLRATIPEFIKIQAAFSQSGFTGQQTRQIFSDVATATKALGLSQATTNRILYDFQEMASLGQIQMRQMRQVMLQVPGGMEILARAVGTTTEKVHDMIKAGTLWADDVLPRFASEMARTFGGATAEAAQNLESNLNRMKNAWDRFRNELGKGTTFSGISGEVSKLLTNDAIMMEIQREGGLPGNFWPSLSRPAERQRLGTAYLNRRFPFAAGAGQPGDKSPGGDVNLVSAYRRMAAEQAARESSQFSVNVAAPGGPLIEKTRELTEKQETDMDRLRELAERLNVEKLSGLQKEEAQIDLNTQKQLDSVRKIMDAFDPVRNKQALAAINAMFGGSPYAAITQAGSIAKQNLINTQDLRDAEKLRDVMSDINIEMAGDREAQAKARINQRYGKLLDQVIDLPQFGSEEYNRIIAARDKALGEVTPKATKTAFSGESFNQLRLGLAGDKAALLTETDEQRFHEIANRIQERSTQLAFKLKANNADMADSFKHGFQSAMEAWGSFDERVAKTGETLANNLSSNFSEAFTSLITGTKSAADAFRDMAASITASLVRMVIEEYVVKSAFQAIFSLGGASNGTATTNMVGGYSHVGGVIGSEVWHGNADFSGAKRYHTGGTVGDEVPLIARRGEVIFTPEQMSVLGKAIASGSGARQRPVQIANLIDERQLAEMVVQNPDVIVNVINRRSGVIKTVLGMNR